MIAYKHPLLALSMTVFLLSLGGLPPFAGFVAKFYIFSAAIEEGKESSSEEENLTEEEKEALARKKAQEEGDAKDLAMKEAADSFTASLPRKGSYDFSKDQEKG